jgi:hypothetical protein
MTNEPTSLADRIGRIEKLETELMRKAAGNAGWRQQTGGTTSSVGI